MPPESTARPARAPAAIRYHGHRVTHATSVLIIDERDSTIQPLRTLLEDAGFVVRAAQGASAGLREIEHAMPDVILCAVQLPGGSGLDILTTARKIDPAARVVLMTRQASLQSAIEAVNRGASYYLQHPIAPEEVISVLRRVAGERPASAALPRTAPVRTDSHPTPMGKSRALTAALRVAQRAAPADSTVLLTGESGTGKEVFARYIHSASRRSNRPFVSINCGALTETLLESELFGHVRGAFTGADRDKQGLFIAATGGTLFLDEVGEMSPATQVKLLRVIQEREVLPVGSTTAARVDVRILAATNRNLEDEVRRGRFRSDLYYRLNVITLDIPPLRDRTEDIPMLAEHFLARQAERQGRALPTLADDTRELLATYPWPGNVREMENALERALLFADDCVLPEHLPTRITEPRGDALLARESLPDNPQLEVLERAYIYWVLQAERGNKTRAAEVLGLDVSTLYRKLKRYSLDAA